MVNTCLLSWYKLYYLEFSPVSNLGKTCLSAIFLGYSISKVTYETNWGFYTLLVAPTCKLTFSLDIVLENAPKIWLQVSGFTLSWYTYYWAKSSHLRNSSQISVFCHKLTSLDLEHAKNLDNKYSSAFWVP